MPTLSEALKKNREGGLVRGQGGQLTKESDESIQSLSAQSGLSSPPLTPAGAGMLGASPDTQKMMGTPAQKTAALDLSAGADNSLATAVRRKQARTEMTGEEAQKKEQSQDMQNLGGLGQRVTSFIEVQRQKLQQAAPQPVAVQSQQSFKDKDLSPIADKLSALRADPENMQLQLEVNEFLGRDVNTVISPEEINQLYESASQAISRGGAETVDDSLTVDKLISDPEFGYDINTLSELLGMPADQISTMNVGQLRSAIQAESDREFSRSEQALDQSSSALAGQAERMQARELGRDLSATGVRASEADVAALEQQIQNADQVSFGGKKYGVDDLLQDETITDIITEYMNSSPDDPFRKQLEDSEPELMDFINKNRAVLEEASKKLSAGATGFRTIQDTNTKTLSLNNQLADDIASQLFPEYKKLSAQAVDPNSIPLIAAGQGASPNYAANISQIVTTDPTLTPELKDLSVAEVKALGLDDPNGTWKKVGEQRKQWDSYSKAQTSGELATQFFGTSLNDDYLNNVVADTRVISLLGYGQTGQLGVLDANGDGKLDSKEQIAGSLMGGDKPGLRSGIEGKLNVASGGSFNPPQPPRAGIQKELYDKLKAPILQNGGQMTPQIVGDMFQAHNVDFRINKKNAEYLNELLKAPGLNPATQRAVRDQLENVKGTPLLNSLLGTYQQEVLKYYSQKNPFKANPNNPQNRDDVAKHMIGYYGSLLQDAKNSNKVSDQFRNDLENRLMTMVKDEWKRGSGLTVDDNYIRNTILPKYIKEFGNGPRPLSEL